MEIYIDSISYTARIKHISNLWFSSVQLSLLTDSYPIKSAKKTDKFAGILTKPCRRFDSRGELV